MLHFHKGPALGHLTEKMETEKALQTEIFVPHNLLVVRRVPYSFATTVALIGVTCFEGFNEN